MSLKELLDLLGKLGPPFVSMVLAFPFVLFIPIPGLSIVFGTVILVLGVRLALHKNLWFPQRLKQKKISADWWASQLEKMSRFLKKIDRYIHPRGTIYQHHPFVQTVHGWGLAVSGFFLLLPLPPGTNFLPGLAAFLISIGLLQEDIWMLILGYVALAINLALFILIPLLVVHHSP